MNRRTRFFRVSFVLMLCAIFMATDISYGAGGGKGGGKGGDGKGSSGDGKGGSSSGTGSSSSGKGGSAGAGKSTGSAGKSTAGVGAKETGGNDGGSGAGSSKDSKSSMSSGKGLGSTGSMGKTGNVSSKSVSSRSVSTSSPVGTKSFSGFNANTVTGFGKMDAGALGKVSKTSLSSTNGSANTAVSNHTFSGFDASSITGFGKMDPGALGGALSTSKKGVTKDAGLYSSLLSEENSYFSFSPVAYTKFDALKPTIVSKPVAMVKGTYTAPTINGVISFTTRIGAFQRTYSAEVTIDGNPNHPGIASVDRTTTPAVTMGRTSISPNPDGIRTDVSIATPMGDLGFSVDPRNGRLSDVGFNPSPGVNAGVPGLGEVNMNSSVSNNTVTANISTSFAGQTLSASLSIGLEHVDADIDAINDGIRQHELETQRRQAGTP